MDCIFCKIIKGEIPSYTIYEDDAIKCFLDVNPESNGHMLIIPKKHFLGLKEIEDDVLIKIMDKARDLEDLLKEKLCIDGLTLIQNNGDVQEVKHFHLHLKPYYKNKNEIIDVKDIYKKIKES